MSRHLIPIRSNADRERAARVIAAAPFGSRVEIKAAKRSLPQNDKMWAALTDVSHQLVWYGKKLPPDDWKLMFLDGLKRELRMMPNLDGTGFVNLGRSSSDLSKQEMSDLIELIHMFGAQHGVIFHDPESSREQQAPSPNSETVKPARAPSPASPARAGDHPLVPA